MKLIEAEKVKRAMKDYWKAQVDKALTLTFIDGNEADKRINSYLEHNHELLKAIDELPSVEAPDINVGNMDIIRCKDCEWWTKQKDSIQGRCALHKMYPSGNWYCGTARRRGE